MTKPLHSLLLLSGLLLLFAYSCSRDDLKSEDVVYINLPDIHLSTDYITEGTSHSKFTTAWIFVNDIGVGAYELPMIAPVIAERGDEIEISPGVSTNGISSTRQIYSYIDPIIFPLDTDPFDTVYFDISGDGIPEVSFGNNKTLVILEDFDEPGLNFQSSTRSDTSLIKISDPNLVFTNPTDTGEDNGKAGAIFLDASNDFGEFISSDSYEFPKGGPSVYLEISYKSNNPFVVGVVAIIPANAPIQRQTLFINPKDEWSKIYVNLSTETSSPELADATGFKVFVSSALFGVDTARIYLDNLRLVY